MTGEEENNFKGSNMEKIRSGYVREDGKVFIRYFKGKEIWGTMESLLKRQETKRTYGRKSRQLAKKLIKEPHSFGDYDHKKNLFYIGISCSGKEIWRDKKFFERYKEKVKINKRRYIEKCKSLESKNLKVGMPNPDNPNEYLIYRVGNKCFFGNKEQLEERKEVCRMAKLKLYFRNKKIRREKLEKLETRRKRGDTRIEDNKIFFYYSDNGNEIWLEPEEFYRRRNRELEKKKTRRQNKKILKEVSSSTPVNPPPHEDSILSNSTNDQI